MGNRIPSTRSMNQAVHRYVGSDMDVVRHVAENMDAVQEVSDLIGNPDATSMLNYDYFVREATALGYVYIGNRVDNVLGLIPSGSATAKSCWWESSINALIAPQDDNQYDTTEYGSENFWKVLSTASSVKDVTDSVNNLYTKREAIEWRAGLKVTDPLQMYVHIGVEYLPNSSKVPFITDESFNSTNWELNTLNITSFPTFAHLMTSSISHPCYVNVLKYDNTSLDVSSRWAITKLPFNELSTQIASGYYATHAGVIAGESINIAELGCTPNFNSVDRSGVDNYAQMQKYLDGKAKLSGSGFFGLGTSLKVRRNYASITGTTATQGDFRLCPLNLDMGELMYIGGENLDESNAAIKNANINSVSASFGANKVNGFRTGLTENCKINNAIYSDMLKGVVQAEFANETSIKDSITNSLFARNTIGIRGGDTRVADGTVSGNTFQDNVQYHGWWGYCDGGHHFNNKVFSDPSVLTDVGFNYINPIFLHVGTTDIFGCGKEAIKLQSPRYSTIDVTIANSGMSDRESAIVVTKGLAAELGTEISAKIYDVGGAGVEVSGVEDLSFPDLVIKGVGTKVQGSEQDAIITTNAKVSFDSLTLDGKGVRPEGGGRYWLRASGSEIRVGDVKSLKNFTNDASSVDSRIIFNNIVELNDDNYAMSFLDDGVISGDITAQRYITIVSTKTILGKVLTFTNNSTVDNVMSLSMQGSQTILKKNGDIVTQLNITKGGVSRLQAISSGLVEM